MLFDNRDIFAVEDSPRDRLEIQEKAVTIRDLDRITELGNNYARQKDMLLVKERETTYPTPDKKKTY